MAKILEINLENKEKDTKLADFLEALMKECDNTGARAVEVSSNVGRWNVRVIVTDKKKVNEARY